MNDVYEAALELQEVLESNSWRFCVIGGVAVIRWGQPRATADVDVSLLSGFGDEASFVDPLLKRFSSRIDDARQFALDNRVLLISATNGVALDRALAAFPYEEQVIDRSSSFEFAPGVELTTAAAEDIVVLKAFAGRDRDWSDVRGIITRQDELDWNLITVQLNELCQLRDDTETLTRLDSIRSDLQDKG